MDREREMEKKIEIIPSSSVLSSFLLKNAAACLT
jgi:hypothetical protein